MMFLYAVLPIKSLSTDPTTFVSKEQLGKELAAKLKEYDRGRKKLIEEKGDAAQDEWHHVHKKDRDAMIELLKKGPDLRMLWDAEDDDDDDDTSAQIALDLLDYFLCHPKTLYDEYVAILMNSGILENSDMRNKLLKRIEPCAIKKLIQQGLKLTFDDDYVVDRALYSSDNEVLELVLNAGGNPNASHWPGGPTVLIGAVDRNNVLAVKTLLNRIDRLDEKHHSWQGQTALHCAFSNILEKLNTDYLRDKYSIIQLLLDKGFTINAVDDEGATPLISAVKHQDGYDTEPDQKLIDLVIANGADPLIKDSQGLSALHYASHKRLNKIISALLTAMTNYQPEKRAEAHSQVQFDVDQILQKNGFYKTIKDRIYDTFDFSRKALALFGACQIALAVNKKFKLVGRRS
jgi:hypothetical protein